MFTRSIIIGLVLTMAGMAVAQEYGRSRSEEVMAVIESHFRARDREKLEAEKFAERRFLEKAASFVKCWNEFVAEYDRGAFSIGKAREVSRAFRILEKSGQWPDAESGSEAKGGAAPRLAAHR